MKIYWIIIPIFLALIIGCNKEGNRRKAGVINSPPVVKEAYITPKAPVRGVDIKVNLMAFDKDGDHISYSYKWIKNGKEIKGNNKNILKGTLFKKGDIIKCIIIPYDGKIYGTPYETEEIKIANSPPIIKSIKILPFPPFKDSKIKVAVDSYDPDNDSVMLAYKWFVNDKEVFGVYENELRNAPLKKGDKVSVEITISDGESKEKSFKSKEVTISNTPPSIVSDPPAFLTKDNMYVYHVLAKDPDNDPLTYEIISGPEGMTIDPDTGIVKWKVSENDIGKVKVEIAAKDNDGGKGLQRFILKIGKSIPEE
jgi:hypothetical protein